MYWIRRKLKLFVIISALGAELILFSYYLYTQPHGIARCAELSAQCVALQEKLMLCKTKHTRLQHEIKRWQEDLFLVEKKARQDLRMARADEVIYYNS